MIGAIDPLIGVAIAAIVGPLGAYLVAARKLSGKVATSDATDLWEESRSIREWSTARISALELELVALRREQRLLLLRVDELTAALSASRARVEQLEEEAAHGA